MFSLFRLLIGDDREHCDEKYYDPIDFVAIDKEELRNFKHDGKKVGQVIGSLSIYPNLIYPIVLNELDFPHVSNNVYSINIKPTKKNFGYKLDLSNIKANMENLVSDLYDDDVRFIMIRLIEGGAFIDHVSCIIVDKIKKYILFFDSKNNIQYDVGKFSFVIDIINNANRKVGDVLQYQVLLPKDIGYGNYTSLQGYNHYCQTYILYILMLVANNPDIEFRHLKQLFDAKITTKKLGLFLFGIHKKIKNNESLKNFEYQSVYPSNTIINFINSVTFMMNAISMNVIMRVFPNLNKCDEIAYAEDGDCIVIL